jgi:hypothetical protein
MSHPLPFRLELEQGSIIPLLNNFINELTESHHKSIKFTGAPSKDWLNEFYRLNIDSFTFLFKCEKLEGFKNAFESALKGDYTWKKIVDRQKDVRRAISKAAEATINLEERITNCERNSDDNDNDVNVLLFILNFLVDGVSNSHGEIVDCITEDGCLSKNILTGFMSFNEKHLQPFMGLPFYEHMKKARDDKYTHGKVRMRESDIRRAIVELSKEIALRKIKIFKQ